MKNQSLLFNLVTVAATVLLAGCGAEPRPRRQTAPAQKPGPVKIIQFYAMPSVVNRGESVTMCYGVKNADKVVIEPNIRTLTLSRNRCFSITVNSTRTYRLIATGAGGKASAKLTLKVRSRAARREQMPLITVFAASNKTVVKQQPVTICYSVNNARDVSIDPPVRKLGPESMCFVVRLDKTTTFRLTATGTDGRKQQQRLTITVR